MLPQFRLNAEIKVDGTAEIKPKAMGSLPHTVSNIEDEIFDG
jgi:hypothetical protein